MTDDQKFLIQGRIYGGADAALQSALARVYGGSERPRCLCVPGGLEMYVARVGRYLVKRMPESGHLHDADCPSYEPEAGQSGLAELLGEAIVESSPGQTDLYLDFPLTRFPRRSFSRNAAGEPPSEVSAPRRGMTLRALLHLLWERAQFNRWTPAMKGRRSWAVVRRYILEAAQECRVKGMPLDGFLYVPEPFQIDQAEAIARRRRDELAKLHGVSDEGASPMMVVIGEFKAVEHSTYGRRIWIKHMPDCPLFIDEKAWLRAQRVFKGLIEAQEADPNAHLRLIMAALVHARAAFTFSIDAISLMLTSSEWIPVEGGSDAQLVATLVSEGRRFLKPLRYDAKASARYPSALLLDTGAAPTPLTVISPVLLDPRQVISVGAEMDSASDGWAWRISEGMPSLPVSQRQSAVR